MIRTVIVDDEPRNIKLVTRLIKEHCPALDVVGTTDDQADLIPLINSLKPSLLLLDIEFPSGTIFRELEKADFRNFQVIFITAHNTYAAEAFRLNAVDYILKPVTPESLVRAIERISERIAHNVPANLAQLLEMLRPGQGLCRRVPLPSSDGILFVLESDIIRCEASGRYTVLFLQGKKKITVTKTLKEIESMLNPGIFYRVHHSHIVNMEFIRKYQRGQGGMVELTDGSLVEVASSRKEEFLGLLTQKPRY